MKDNRGLDVVAVSAPRNEWTVQMEGSEGRCHEVGGELYILAENLFNNCVILNKSEQECREYQVAFLQRRNSRCEQSDGGPLFVPPGPKEPALSGDILR